MRVLWTAKRSNQPILKKSVRKSVYRNQEFIGRTDVEAPILWLPDAKN